MMSLDEPEYERWRLTSGWTPADHYTADDASTALQDARLVRGSVGRCWLALLEAAAEEPDGRSGGQDRS